MNTNVTRKADGSSCWEATQCVSDTCTDFTCAAAAATAAGGGGGGFKATAANGAACTVNGECAEGWCNESVCAAKGTAANGASCVSDDFCASGGAV